MSVLHPVTDLLSLSACKHNVLSPRHESELSRTTSIPLPTRLGLQLLSHNFAPRLPSHLLHPGHLKDLTALSLQRLPDPSVLGRAPRQSAHPRLDVIV